MRLSEDLNLVELIAGAGKLRWGEKTWLRKREPRRAPLEWELPLLQLVIEQYAMPLDQLGRFAGCSERRTEALVEHLMRVGYVDYDRIVRSESPWVWLTKRGAHYAGLGMRSTPPHVGAMERIRAVNEVRLYLEERMPEHRWISSRRVVQRYGRAGSRVNGAMEVGDELHAVKVELVRRDYERRRRGVEGLLQRYDAVIAFCEDGARVLFDRMVEEEGWTRLYVRGLPTPPD